MANKKKHITTEQRTEIVDMRMAGLTYKSISSLTGISISAMCNLLQRIEFNAFIKDINKYDSYEKCYFATAFKNGVTYDIAKGMLYTLPTHSKKLT